MQTFLLLFLACTENPELTKKDVHIFDDYANSFFGPKAYHDEDISIRGKNYDYDVYLMSNNDDIKPDHVRVYFKENDKNLSGCAWMMHVIWALPKSAMTVEKINNMTSNRLRALSEIKKSDDGKHVLWYTERAKQDLQNVAYTIVCSDCQEDSVDSALFAATQGQCLPMFKNVSAQYRQKVLDAVQKSKY